MNKQTFKLSTYMQDTITISHVPGSIYSVIGNNAFGVFLSLSDFKSRSENSA